MDAIAKIKLRQQEIALKQKALDKEANEIAELIRLAEKYIPGVLATNQNQQEATGRGNSKKAQVLAVVPDILADGQPKTTAAILNELKSRGIEVGGQNEEQNLSSHLSRAKTNQDVPGLTADRKLGWFIQKHSEQDATEHQQGGDLLS